MVPLRRIAQDCSFCLLWMISALFTLPHVDTSSSVPSSVLSLLLIPFQLSFIPRPLPPNLAPPSRKASLYPVCVSIQPSCSFLRPSTSDPSNLLSIAMRFHLYSGLSYGLTTYRVIDVYSRVLAILRIKPASSWLVEEQSL
jgi:hypothetical protein